MKNKEHASVFDEEEMAPLHSGSVVPSPTPRGSRLEDAIRSWMSRNVVIVVTMVGILGLLLGTLFRSSASSVRGSIRQEIIVQFVSEYDLIRTHSTFSEKPSGSNGFVNSPMDFETAMRATGITEEEYADCNTSIRQDPDRNVCSKVGSVSCLKKKVKYVQDKSGEIIPTYIKEGATEVTCPYNMNVGNGPMNWRWSDECYDSVIPGGQLICYPNVNCEEEKSQWTATLVVSNGQRDSNGFTYHWESYAAGWLGGLNPANVTWWEPTLTEPYEGKFCLQKAALKALSRNGWELIEPYDAFTAEIWKVVKRSAL